MEIAITGEGPGDYGKIDFMTGKLEPGAAEGYSEAIAVEYDTENH